MAENSTLLSLPQLVDLSLNCQEGLVHFHALHALLHVVIQQASLEDVTVEFRGTDGERIRGIIANSKPVKGSQFMEYSISGGKKRKSSRKVSLQDVKEQTKIDKGEKLDKIETAKEKELRVIERRKNSKEDPDLNPPPLKSLSSSMVNEQFNTMVLVDSKMGLPQLSVAVTKEIFENLQTDLEKVKEEMRELKELPGNMGLVKSIKDKDSPILDMFQILTLVKRMEAAEENVVKLGSLLEDIVRMSQNKEDTSSDMMDKIREVRDSIVSKDGDSEQREGSSNVKELLKEIDKLEARVDMIEKFLQDASGEDFKQIKIDDEEKAQTDDEEKVKIDEKKREKNKDQETKDYVSKHDSLIKDVNLSELSTDEALDLLQKEILNITAWVEENLKDMDKHILSGGGGGEGGGGDGKVNVKVQALDSKLENSCKKLEEFDSLYNNQITLLNQQLQSLQKEIENILIKLDFLQPGGDATGIKTETTLELGNKLLLLEKEIISVGEQAAQLQADKVELTKNLDTVLEQIDILKIVKANREDLEDALDDKADACQINRKVSHDQFDAACDDLSRGIEEALNKLQEQEDMWRRTLDTIQQDIGQKLDKNEVDPLRDFVNSKLKALQEKFKSLVALKKEQEAAGSKSKLLRDVNCISCDKEVVMRKTMDPSLKPKPYAMPAPKNIAPYLAYELDQLRKQQKCLPGSKNLNFLEKALKTKKEKEHICNRYCGGSHTVTTPQQRVARLGHFLEQWGPDIGPAQDEYIRGKDGQMYKARDDSVVGKTSKTEAPEAVEKPSIKSGEGVPKDQIQAGTTYINPSAERLLTQERDQNDDFTKKPIGSTSVKPKTSSLEKVLRANSSKSIQGSVTPSNESQPQIGTMKPPEAKKLEFQD